MGGEYCVAGRREPSGSRRETFGSRREHKGSPRDPKGSQRKPKGSRREHKGSRPDPKPVFHGNWQKHGLLPFFTVSGQSHRKTDGQDGTPGVLVPDGGKLLWCLRRNAAAICFCRFRLFLKDFRPWLPFPPNPSVSGMVLDESTAAPFVLQNEAHLRLFRVRHLSLLQ